MSRIQDRFPAVDGNPERPPITGFPLLVYRRMLNVAATRAKRSLYVIGNCQLWKGASFFADAASCLPHIGTEEWACP